MPRVLLVIPPCFINSELDFEVGFPVNLLLLGQQIRASGWGVTYLDMTLEEKEGGNSFAELDQRLNDLTIELVGISNHTVRTSVTTRTVAEHIKSVRPDIKLVVGGVNSTFMWRELLELCPSIDYVLRGYAQSGMRALLSSLHDVESRSIPGLAMRRGGAFHLEPLVSIAPADFAAPEFDGLDITRYLDWTKTYPLLTNTGCGFTCNFCTSVMPGPYQSKEVYRPIKDVLREMRQAFGAGFERFFMTANVFTSNKKYCLELCAELMNDEVLNRATWVCMTRVEFVDEDLLLAMRQAGCENIAFGLETVGLEQWRSLRKGRFSEEVIFKAFGLTARAGIGTTVYLMLGSPTQTQVDIEATVELVRMLDPDYRVVSFFQPFPGTPYWESPEKFGLSEIAPLEDWNFHEAPICRTKYLNKQSLFDAAIRLYLERADQPRLKPESDNLELIVEAKQLLWDMPLPARDAFSNLNNFRSVRELLESIKEKHGARGRLIALYWLAAARRDGLLGVSQRNDLEQNESALLGV